ncbi:MAG: hypothetical protein WC284_09220 [Candidimonas sp.]
MIGWAALAATVRDFGATVIYGGGRAVMAVDDIVVRVPSLESHVWFSHLCHHLGCSGQVGQFVGLFEDGIDDYVVLMDGRDGRLSVKTSKTVTLWVVSFHLMTYRTDSFVIDWSNRHRGPRLIDY